MAKPTATATMTAAAMMATATMKTPAAVPLPALCSSPAVTDELVIDVTGDNGHFSVTLNTREVSRLRSRYGKGTEFEKWVSARIRDLLNGFGGM